MTGAKKANRLPPTTPGDGVLVRLLHKKLSDMELRTSFLEKEVKRLGSDSMLKSDKGMGIPDPMRASYFWVGLGVVVVGLIGVFVGVLTADEVHFEEANPPYLLNGNWLALLYMLILLNYFGRVLSCDLQAMLSQPQWWWVQYIMAFFIFFLSLGLGEGADSRTLGKTMVQSTVMIIVFIISCKNKWMFALPTLMLLCADQVMLVVSKTHASVGLTTARAIVVGAAYSVLFGGFVHYVLVSREEYGRQFKWLKLFRIENTTCDDVPLKARLWKETCPACKKLIHDEFGPHDCPVRPAVKVTRRSPFRFREHA